MQYLFCLCFSSPHQFYLLPKFVFVFYKIIIVTESPKKKLTLKGERNYVCEIICNLLFINFWYCSVTREGFPETETPTLSTRGLQCAKVTKCSFKGPLSEVTQLPTASHGFSRSRRCVALPQTNKTKTWFRGRDSHWFQLVCIHGDVLRCYRYRVCTRYQVN